MPLLLEEHSRRSAGGRTIAHVGGEDSRLSGLARPIHELSWPMQLLTGPDLRRDGPRLLRRAQESTLLFGASLEGGKGVMIMRTASRISDKRQEVVQGGARAKRTVEPGRAGGVAMLQCRLGNRGIQQLYAARGTTGSACDRVGSATVEAGSEARSLAEDERGSCNCGGTLELARRGEEGLRISHACDRAALGPEAATTLLPVDEGTETLATSTSTLDDGGLGTTTAAPECSGTGVTGRFTDIPNGVTLAARLVGNKLTADFRMIGEYTPIPSNCSASCGEYRQYVRGEFTKNGSRVAHRLCANSLDPTTFYEDCARIGGTDYKYGYRSIRFGTSYFDSPDQANGTRFNGYDAPGITGSSGDALMVNLDFRGELVDVCNSTVLQTAEWSVAGSATVP